MTKKTQPPRPGRARTFFRSAAGTSLLSLLAACGGGGGDSGTPIQPGDSSLSISAANYQQVAQVAVSSAGYLLDTGDFAFGEQPGGSAIASPGGRLVTIQQVRPTAVTSDTVNCTQGGSLLFSFNDLNNNASWDVGDSLSAEARNCREDGMTIQGKLGLNAKALSGVFGGSSYSATLQLTLTDFAVTEGSDTATGNGSFDMQVGVSGGTTELTLMVDSLTIVGSESGKPYSDSLRDARLSLRFPATGGSTSSTSATVSSNRLDNKSVRIETASPFVTTVNSAFPSSGQLLITGASGSKLRLSAQNAAQVLLELDADGDGSFETRSTKAWSELY